ncbi:MAG: hypothetical protein EP349_00310 [Alphaproteobacteria bacterium]|nr:MAG: hypothetical protein EP349_00310 [Alphaproteobacteria bacterium]
MFSSEILKAWVCLIMTGMLAGVMDHIFGLDHGITGVMLYVSVYVIGATGLPVWEAPVMSYAEWPVPNTLGCILGIAVWLLVFYGIAYLHAQDRGIRSMRDEQEKRMKNKKK